MDSQQRAALIARLRSRVLPADVIDLLDEAERLSAVEEAARRVYDRFAPHAANEDAVVLEQLGTTLTSRRHTMRTAPRLFVQKEKEAKA